MENTYNKPEGEKGWEIVERMNDHHAKLAEWGFSHVEAEKSDSVLDIGCGGGSNVGVWLDLCSDGKVTGIDHSEVSVKKSSDFNADAIKDGRCSILQGNVADMPFDDESFDWISAFETVYFWPGLDDCFREVSRVMKKGGAFLICNETDGHDDASSEWETRIPDTKVYTAEQLMEALRKAGFAEIKTDSLVDKHWLTITAIK
jgi:ubiquinone/menaquinone biosynthesis C-methylase UbiE